MTTTVPSLQSALFANAVFSALTGIPLSFFPIDSSNILGLNHPNILRLIGILLLFHAIILVWVKSRSTIYGWVKINLGIIAPYPFIILALITFGHISGAAGVILAGVDGLIVGLIAVWQYRRSVTEKIRP